MCRWLTPTTATSSRSSRYPGPGFPSLQTPGERSLPQFRAGLPQTPSLLAHWSGDENSQKTLESFLLF